MIKGLILDVDGVLVGAKEGYNWPLPNPQVIQVLKSLREKGMIVSLCTGKGSFAIKQIVELAHLDNVHIGDGGAMVIDTINNKIIDEHIIDTTTVLDILHTFLLQNIYIELYTKDGYYTQDNFIGDKTNKHKAILYKEPNIVESLEKIVKDLKVVKIMPVVDNEVQKQEVIDLFASYQANLTLQWGVYPTALPYEFGIITLKGISKRQATMVISKNSGVPLGEMLGIGDTMTDWQFMEICGYAGAMGNASQELKDKVKLKEENGYIGKSVDENGLIDILENFELL
jgi:HAD superfamily hydrolase (TIGR01484 family)